MPHQARSKHSAPAAGNSPLDPRVRASLGGRVRSRPESTSATGRPAITPPIASRTTWSANAGRELHVVGRDQDRGALSRQLADPVGDSCLRARSMPWFGLVETDQPGTVRRRHAWRPSRSPAPAGARSPPRGPGGSAGAAHRRSPASERRPPASPGAPRRPAAHAAGRRDSRPAGAPVGRRRRPRATPVCPRPPAAGCRLARRVAPHRQRALHARRPAPRRAGRRRRRRPARAPPTIASIEHQVGGPMPPRRGGPLPCGGRAAPAGRRSGPSERDPRPLAATGGEPSPARSNSRAAGVASATSLRSARSGSRSGHRRRRSDPRPLRPPGRRRSGNAPAGARRAPRPSPLLVQAAEQADEFVAGNQVELGGRLVEQHPVAVGPPRPPPAPPAAARRRRGRRRDRGAAGSPARAPPPRPPAPGRRARNPHLQRQLDLRPHRRRDDLGLGVLGDHADRPAERSRAMVANVEPRHLHLARDLASVVVRHQPAQEARQGGLARPGPSATTTSSPGSISRSTP